MAAPVVENSRAGEKSADGGVPKKRKLHDGREAIPRRVVPQRPPSKMIVPGVSVRPPPIRPAARPKPRPQVVVPASRPASRPALRLATPTQRPIRGKAPPPRPLVVPGLKSKVTPHKAPPPASSTKTGKVPGARAPLAQPRPRPRGIERLVAQPPRPVVPGAAFRARPQNRLRGRGGAGPHFQGPRRPFHHDPYGLDELTEEDRAFIDDGNDGGDDEVEWRKALRDLTGYDPSKFAHVDVGEAAESNLYKVEAEEHLSELLARREDYEEYKKSLEAGGDDEEEEEWEEEDES